MSSYSTHQPMLLAALNRSVGPVIEFGCGHGSTELLHDYCQLVNRPLATLESDPEWFAKFVKYRSPGHEFVLVDSWTDILCSPQITGVHYGVAFVDQSPWLARYSTILALRDTAQFIVLHDCDYFPEHGIFGVNVKGLNGTNDRGLRTYDDVFKYYKEYFPPEPWPFARTGPPTLVGSNFENCDWEL